MLSGHQGYHLGYIQNKTKLKQKQSHNHKQLSLDRFFLFFPLYWD